MKRITSITLFGLATLALAAGTMSPSDVLKKRDELDNKSITVAGQVKNFKAKTSKAGNAYITFDLTSGKDSIAVFSHGKLAKDLANGTKVQIKGKFAKEKKVGTSTFKNEVDASGKKGEKPNITILK